MNKTGYVLFVAILLFSCRKQSIEPSPLPKGIQEISGYLVSTELSLVRRGTHLLLQDGIKKYFVESKIVALREFEEKQVTIRGILQYNTDPKELPILIAEEVRTQEESWKNISHKILGLTMDIPPQWSMQQANGGILFVSASSMPIVRIIRQPFSASSAGMPVRIGNRSGLRILDEKTGRQQIIIPEDDDEIFIEFMPQQPDQLQEERTLFLRLLHSIEWQQPLSTSSRSSVLKEYGVPCGGPAGVLCPTGFYCEVMDFKEGIGRCVKI